MAQQGNDEGGAFDALRNPVGPKSKGVYIRRRIAVLAVLLAVIAAVVLVIVRPGSADGARNAAEIEVPSDTSPQATQNSDDELAACAEGQLAVTALVSQESYAEGEYPQLALSVENTGDAPCTANLGTSGIEFVITSGDDEVWRSADCQADSEDLAAILDPGEPEQTEWLEWDRTRSSTDTCDAMRDPVAAGGATYHLRASVAGVQSAETASFLLY